MVWLCWISNCEALSCSASQTVLGVVFGFLQVLFQEVVLGKMELYQLRYVLEVAKEHSFSKAAESLYITQPTLSQQIKKLEESLGNRIFFRTTKNVSLTPFGVEFVTRAVKVMKNYEELEEWLCRVKVQKS